MRMQPGDELLLDIATTQVRWDFDPIIGTFNRLYVDNLSPKASHGSLAQSAEDFESILSQRSPRSEYKPPTMQSSSFLRPGDGKAWINVRAYYFDKFCAWITRVAILT